MNNFWIRNKFIESWFSKSEKKLRHEQNLENTNPIFENLNIFKIVDSNLLGFLTMCGKTSAINQIWNSWEGKDVSLICNI